MKERPLIFSGPMVRAILEGRKTQTRRIYRPQPLPYQGPPKQIFEEQVMRTLERGRCPYGAPGDRLWIRETCKVWYPCRADGEPVTGSWRATYRADNAVRDLAADWDEGYSFDSPTDLKLDVEPARWRPSIHMPRWASRIVLEVVNVTVQRLQWISAVDVDAEGVPPLMGPGAIHWADPFRATWEDLHGAHAWDRNPWVWAIEFDRIAD